MRARGRAQRDARSGGRRRPWSWRSGDDDVPAWRAEVTAGCRRAAAAATEGAGRCRAGFWLICMR